MVAMKKPGFFTLLLLLSLLSGYSWSQTDSLKTIKPQSTLWYMGLGTGPNTRGMNFNWSITVTSMNGLGASLNLYTGFIRLENVPSDYYSDWFRWTTPSDRFTVLSCNLVKKFISPKGSFRLGFEAGPAWVYTDLLTLELNPRYPDPFEYKYNKIHTIRNSTGLTLAIKSDFPFLNVGGVDVALIGVINSYRSIVGLDVCIIFGRVRKIKYTERQ